MSDKNPIQSRNRIAHRNVDLSIFCSAWSSRGCFRISPVAIIAIAVTLGAALVGCGGSSSAVPGRVTTTDHAPSHGSKVPQGAPTDPLPFPSWWSGNCDSGNYNGSYPLGGVVRGVPACGPGPNMGGSDHLVHFYSGAWGEYEWECVELVMRYMYLAYNVQPYGANGWNVVDNYPGSFLVKVQNNGLGPLPAPGDILSYGNGSAAQKGGHTSVVSTVTLDPLGNETSITVVEQNNSSGGTSTLNVVGGIVIGGPYHVRNWLHYPGGATPTPTPTPTPTAISGAFEEFSSGISPSAWLLEMAVGSDGNLWITENTANQIARVTPSKVVTEFPVPSASAQPDAITAGPDGNLWFTEYGVNKIAKISTIGLVTEYSTGITPNAGLYGIVTGADGNLWFTEQNANKIGKITTSGVVTEYSNGLTAFAGPAKIARGSDGNLWFTEVNVNRIGRMTTSGTVVAEYAAGISSGSGMSSITPGPDGNLWFTEYSIDRVARITTGGVVTEFANGISAYAGPAVITAGPDGNLWFTEGGGGSGASSNSLGRITTSGVVTEFPASTPYSGSNYVQLHGIVTGPDSALWYTELRSNRIGRMH